MSPEQSAPAGTTSRRGKPAVFVAFCAALALSSCAARPRASAASAAPLTAPSGAPSLSAGPSPSAAASAPAPNLGRESALAAPAGPSAAPASTAPPVAAADNALAAGASDEPEGHIDGENVYEAAHPESASAAATPPLVDSNHRPLPQTDARPSTKTPSFAARIELLAKAIVTGHADTALPAFFPVVAYAQVKDIPAPEKDWQHRLVGAFRRDIAEYSKQLGTGAGKATFVRIDVPEQRAKMMKPGSEGNRVGYYRVLRSKLVFRLPSGKEQSFEVTSMISWRGEWYVVHLHGFK